MVTAFSAWPALPFQSLQDLCRTGDGLRDLPRRPPGTLRTRRTPRPAPGIPELLSERPWFPVGWQCPLDAEESLLHSSGWQVHIRCLCERLVGRGNSTQWKSQHREGCLDPLSEIPGVKQPAIGVTPVIAAANFSTTHWPLFLEDMTLT